MPTTGHLPFEVRGYCGTCGKEFGAAKPSCYGYRVRCADGHLAQVIADGPTASWWLRREAWLLRWQATYSPFPLLRNVFRSLDAGAYLVAYFGVLVLALLLEGIALPPLYRSVTDGAFGLLIIWRFIDIFLSNTSINFTTRFPQSPLRSVALSVAAYLQIVLCYAYFYCVLHDIGQMECAGSRVDLVGEAVYYSFGTITTIGRGELVPAGYFGKLFVISELLAGLYFVVIIIAQVSSWSALSKVELGTFPWGELQRERPDGHKVRT
jgi:hypothetical protein